MRNTFLMMLSVLVLMATFGCSEDSDNSNAQTASADVATNDTGSASEDTASSTNDVGTSLDVDDCSANCPDGQLFDPEKCICTERTDLDAVPTDFECLANWDLVRRFRITNKIGRLDDALAVANNPDGGVYPPGTIIQLIPDEAMVKRAPGFSPLTNDWEFFFLRTSSDGTEIVSRGTTDVVNAFGGNCFDCHAKAAPKWDLVCEQDHGCDPLGIGDSIIDTLQNGDPRCP